MKMPHSKFISYENILINKIITNNCVTHTYTKPNYHDVKKTRCVIAHDQSEVLPKRRHIGKSANNINARNFVGTKL